MSTTEQHVMVDIETTGTNPQKHAIVSIGAVKFDEGGIIDEFSREIDVEESMLKHEREADDETLEWIEGQEVSFSVHGDRLSVVLTDFSQWLPRTNYKIWANSPSFDCEFLKHAYAICGMDVPWNFWDQRDVRTAEQFYEYITGETPPDPEVEGDAHDPLYDATKQAISVLMIQREARGN